MGERFVYSLRTQREQPNPRFLDAKLFNELVLTLYREAKFKPYTGPYLFEFKKREVRARDRSA